jgi:hypothetical protein
MSDLDDKIRDLYKAELKRAKAEMNAARDEVACLLQRHEKTHGPVQRKKSGRPSIWKGFIGAVLVKAVEEIIIRMLRGGEDGDEEERSVDLYDPEDYGLLEMADGVHAHSPKGSRRLYSLAQAIRKAVKTHPILQKHRAVFSRLSDRALQARYQQAADFWSGNRRRAFDREWKAVRSRLQEATEEVNRLCDFLDLLDEEKPRLRGAPQN